MLILRWIINALSLLIVAQLVPGFSIHSFWTALIAALVLGFVNATIRIALIFLTLPITILTLGAFTLVMVAGGAHAIHVAEKASQAAVLRVPVEVTPGEQTVLAIDMPAPAGPRTPTQQNTPRTTIRPADHRSEMIDRRVSY